MCPVQSTLLFRSKNPMVNWFRFATDSEIIKNVFVIIGEIMPVDKNSQWYKNANIDFYAKSNKDLGSGLLDTLEKLGLIERGRFSLNDKGMIIPKA